MLKTALNTKKKKKASNRLKKPLNILKISVKGEGKSTHLLDFLILAGSTTSRERGTLHAHKKKNSSLELFHRLGKRR